ncbi:MAG: UMP kinase [Anaerolinea sp.]|nr:UMP kinase [Anaerolinea sp.]
MRYKRILVKLSGGAFAGDKQWGLEPNSLNYIADEILKLHQEGIQVAVVVGGGNIFKGELGETWGIERAEADNIGMIATVINALMLRGVFKARTQVEIRVMTAIPMESVAEPYIRLRAIRHLEHGSIVILAAGTGNPYVTTDYPAVQRALELRAEALLFAKNGTDGIYTADPHKDPASRRYRTITYETFIRQNLQALDQSSVILARDYTLPIHLFGFNMLGAMYRICNGEDIGTVICKDADELA